MTFPYKLEDPTGPFRTCEQYWQNAADAVLSGSPVGGFNYIYIWESFRDNVTLARHI